MSNMVKVVIEIDMDEEEEDHIGGCTLMKYHTQGDAVYENWIVRPGKTDSSYIGQLLSPEGTVPSVVFTDFELRILSQVIGSYMWENSDEYSVNEERMKALRSCVDKIVEYLGNG